MKTIFVKPNTVKRQWFLIDAEGRVLGDVAAEAASILRGKKRAYYTPHQQVGDFVIIINAAKAIVTGNKAQDKMYHHHSGHLGGLKSFSYQKMLVRRPDRPMRDAVKGMLPKGPLGNAMLRSAKIYADAKHPHQSQQPTLHNW
ncbi:MAG: 50S ribosomal protein L13 [Spirochaetaceae bacterium]|nr:50S ribosomal protein L13 [Spirochaetaceae bacterium]